MVRTGYILRIPRPAQFEIAVDRPSALAVDAEVQRSSRVVWCTSAERSAMNETTNAAPYLRIAAEIRRRIQAGELRPGDRVPSTRGLVQEFGVAMATATKALATLQQDGVVHSLPGVGTVVGPPPRATKSVRRLRPSDEPL